MVEFDIEFVVEFGIEFGIEFGMALGALVLSIGLVVCANAGVARTAASAAIVKVCLIIGFLLWRFAESAAHKHAPPKDTNAYGVRPFRELRNLKTRNERNSNLSSARCDFVILPRAKNQPLPPSPASALLPLRVLG
ncbi:MAG: hypothetical protein ACRECA_10440, partial [Pseudolabrys sp.]